MIKSNLKIIFLGSLFLVLGISASIAQNVILEHHIEVAMRKIGHEVLLSSGDSTGLILPVAKKGERYQISFERNFSFTPDSLVGVIHQVVLETEIAKRYMVQFVDCDSLKVVYDFENSLNENEQILPCLGRVVPSGCYSIMFTIIESNNPFELQSEFANGVRSSNSEGSISSWLVAKSLIVLVLIGLLLFLLLRNRSPNSGGNTFKIGTFQFDVKNLRLINNGVEEELTSKEADLLFLLNANPNITLERETILKEVWGDEGAYVGRTLDVFISKLRKKLESDKNIKILNVRGVGYRLILND